MADLPVGNEGDLNGATAVTAVPAPAADEQHVIAEAVVYNADTVAHDVTFQKKKGSSVYVLTKVLAVAAGAVAKLAQACVVLDATDETLEAKIEGAHTTTTPTFEASYMRCS